jgi:hypothetical protein
MTQRKGGLARYWKMLREERAGKKSKILCWKNEIGDFSFINPHETEMMLGKEKS